VKFPGPTRQRAEGRSWISVTAVRTCAAESRSLRFELSKMYRKHKSTKRSQQGNLFLVVLLVAGLSSSPCYAAKHRFNVADDIGLTYFGDPFTGEVEAVTFSPNGRYFAVDSERGLLDQNCLESTLRVYSVDDVHQFVLHADRSHEPLPVWVFSKSTYKDGPIITNIRWLADSSGIAFLAKTSTGNNQLFLADLGTKIVDAVTAEDQHVTAFDIRTRDSLVFSVLSPTLREKAILESRETTIVGTGRSFYHLMFPLDFAFANRVYDLSDLWAVANGRRFRIEDPISHKPIPLHYEGQQVLALSPDGRSVVTALTVAAIPPEWETLYPPSSPHFPWRIKAGPQDPEAPDGHDAVSEYVWIDLSSGEIKPLTGAPAGGDPTGWESANLTSNWSPDGKSVVLSSTFLPSNTADSDHASSRPCVAIVDLVKTHVTCLERLKGQAGTKSGYEEEFHFIVSARFVGARGDRVVVDYSAPDGSKSSARYILTDKGSWSVAATSKGEAGQNYPIDISVKESFTDPPTLVATEKTTKKSRVILDPNPQLRDIALGEASVCKWKDKNGRDWVGGLYKPPDYIRGQRYPLVVQTHGFSESFFIPSGVFPTAFAARELAAIGILVLQVPDCPYTVNPEEASCFIAGYEAGVSKLVDNGLVDPNRVGIIGFSRTCFYVMGMLTTSMMHLSAASITDGVNFGYLQYLTGVDHFNNSNARDADAVIGARPFGDGLQQWLKRSPEFNMDRVTAPLLVVAPGRIALPEMWEPYAALRYLNKPVDLIVLAAGTHVMTNPSQRMASQGTTVDWFRFWLKGEEDQDPSKADQYVRWRELRRLQEHSKKAR
jgi:dipeptidyl aminopeptidase/acylaminoacyl peptidase